MTEVLAQFWMPTGEQLFLFLPEFALVATLVVLLVAPLVVGRNPYTSAMIVLAGALATLILALVVGRHVSQQGMAGLAPDGAAGMLIADNFSIFFKVFLMLFLCGITALWGVGSASTEKNAPEFFVLLVGSALGMILMVSTTHLLMIVIAMELASLPSYAIAGFDKRNRLGSEAALKYVVFGAVCAASMVYGISLLYGLYGSFDLQVVSAGVVNSIKTGEGTLAMSLALVTLLMGVGFKVSAVPFHFWCPDVFQGAKAEVTTWLSVASKAAGIGLMLRICFALGAAVPNGDTQTLSAIAAVIGVVAAVTCTVGNLAAYMQTNVRRMLAYSSIAHAGYMMMVVAIFTVPGTPGAHQAMSAVMVYLVVYMFMNLGAFGVSGIVGWRTGDESFASFTGLGRRAPWLAVPMLFCLVSLTGLPPFGGFIAKWWLLAALGQAGGVMWVLVIVAVLNTLLSLFYYMRVAKQMFLMDDGRPVISVPGAGAMLINLCGVVLLITGVLYISPLKRATDQLARNLFQPAGQTAMHHLPNENTVALNDERPASD